MDFYGPDTWTINMEPVHEPPIFLTPPTLKKRKRDSWRNKSHTPQQSKNKQKKQNTSALSKSNVTFHLNIGKIKLAKRVYSLELAYLIAFYYFLVTQKTFLWLLVFLPRVKFSAILRRNRYDNLQRR